MNKENMDDELSVILTHLISELNFAIEISKEAELSALTERLEDAQKAAETELAEFNRSLDPHTGSR